MLMYTCHVSYGSSWMMWWFCYAISYHNWQYNMHHWTLIQPYASYFILITYPIFTFQCYLQFTRLCHYCNISETKSQLENFWGFRRNLQNFCNFFKNVLPRAGTQGALTLSDGNTCSWNSTPWLCQRGTPAPGTVLPDFVRGGTPAPGTVLPDFVRGGTPAPGTVLPDFVRGEHLLPEQYSLTLSEGEHLLPEQYSLTLSEGEHLLAEQYSLTLSEGEHLLAMPFLTTGLTLPRAYYWHFYGDILELK